MTQQLRLGLEPIESLSDERLTPPCTHSVPARWTPPAEWDDARRRALAVHARLWRGESGLTLEAPDKSRRVFAVAEWPAVLAALDRLEEGVQ